MNSIISRPVRIAKSRLERVSQHSLLARLLPLHCLMCNRPVLCNNSICCQECYPSLPFHTFACQQCGSSFAAEDDHCGKCLLSPPSFDACFCAFRYEHPLDQQIRAFKYGGKPELATHLAHLLYREITANELALPDLLLPVPIHTSKLRQRGYNQSLELTKALSFLLKIPMSNKMLVKSRRTKPQMKLSLKERSSNVKGSFSVTDKLPFKHVALVDDVLTTGATVEEISKLLKRNGVDYIQVWGVAHTN